MAADLMHSQITLPECNWPDLIQVKKPFGTNICFLHNQVAGWINDKCIVRILGMTLVLQCVQTPDGGFKKFEK